MSEYQCGNCGHTDEEEKFPPARDVLERHAPGDSLTDSGDRVIGTFSDAVCPECGALAFPADSVAAYHSLRCPKCKGDERIEIQVTTWVRLCFEGTDDAELNNDKEWDSDSPAVCNECDFSGTVLDFEIKKAIDVCIAGNPAINGRCDDAACVCGGPVRVVTFEGVKP